MFITLTGPLAQATPLSPGAGLGDAVRVNEQTAGSQRAAAVANDVHGGFLVVYGSHSFGNSNINSIDLSRFSVSGQPLQTASIATNPYFNEIDAAMSASGQIVVVWQAQKAGTNFDISTLFGQRFDANLTPVGPRFTINDNAISGRALPSVAADAAGDFVVSWNRNGPASDRILLRRYDADGQPQGEPFGIDTQQYPSQFKPDVAMAADGRFVLTFSVISNGQKNDLFGQRYNVDGRAAGSVFPIDQQYDEVDEDLAVAMAADGRFVVTWADIPNSGNILARYYDAQGNPQGNLIQLPSPRVLSFSPDVAMDATGDFVIVWSNTGCLVGQLFDENSQRRGGRFELTPDCNDDSDNDSPMAAMDADGDITTVYTDDNGEPAPDIYASRFVGPEAVDLALTLSSDPASVARRGVFNYRLLITNNHDPVAPITTSVAGTNAINAAIGAASTVVAGLLVSDQVRIDTGNVTSSQDGAVSCETVNDADLPDDSSELDCTLPQVLAAGGSATLILPATAPDIDGVIKTVAVVSGAQHDPGESTDGSGNNFGSVSTTVGQGQAVGGGGSNDNSDSDDSSGGGCTMGDPNAPVDPIFVLLIMLAVGVIACRPTRAR